MSELVGTAAVNGGLSAGKFAEDKFRLAVEACPSGMLMTDSIGIIVLVNSETERLFGYRRDELVGQSIEILVPERLRAVHCRQRTHFAAHPSVRHIEARHNLCGRRRDGSEFPVEIGLNPIHTGDGLFVLNVVIDISDRQRMDRLKDEFVSNVNHELRTPLTSIAGSLGLMAGGAAGKLPQTATRLVNIAQANCQRLLRLINDVLDLEKMESGRLDFHFQRVDARALVEQVIDANAAYAAGFGVRIHLDPAAEAGEVLADPDRLAQVVTNLLSNAVKFSPHNGEVSITTVSRAGMMRISVRDHGEGIPAEFKPHVFEKFAQAERTDARRKGGTGLGLSIVKQIVDRLGGQIQFADAEGSGTVFYVDLPVWQKIADCAVDTAQQAEAVPVLLCEDDPDLAWTVREGLRPLGFSIDFSHDATDAAERATSKRYAALIVDIRLPNAGGLDFVRKLREQPGLYRTPIVIIGANRESDPDDAARLYVLGWIEKPVDIAGLGNLLEKARVPGANGRPRILHIDEDADARRLVAHALEPIGTVVSVTTADDARRAVEADDFDLAVLDTILDPKLTLLADLRDRRGRSIPVVIFSLFTQESPHGQQVAAQLNKSHASLEELIEVVRDRLRVKRPEARGSP